MFGDLGLGLGFKALQLRLEEPQVDARLEVSYGDMPRDLRQ